MNGLLVFLIGVVAFSFPKIKQLAGLVLVDQAMASLSGHTALVVYKPSQLDDGILGLSFEIIAMVSPFLVCLKSTGIGNEAAALSKPSKTYFAYSWAVVVSWVFLLSSRQQSHPPPRSQRKRDSEFLILQFDGNRKSESQWNNIQKTEDLPTNLVCFMCQLHQNDVPSMLLPPIPPPSSTPEPLQDLSPRLSPRALLGACPPP